MRVRFADIILVALVVLSVSSCDFLRSVAGRPTSEYIAGKRTAIEQRKAFVADSLKREAEIKALEQARIRDSLDALSRLAEMNVNMSSVFRFGTPLDSLGHRYYVMLGVFRNPSIASSVQKNALSHGFNSGKIMFEGGIRAIYMEASDSVTVLPELIERGVAEKVCPKDAWIYVKPE